MSTQGIADSMRSDVCSVSPTVCPFGAKLAYKMYRPTSAIEYNAVNKENLYGADSPGNSELSGASK